MGSKIQIKNNQFDFIFVSPGIDIKKCNLKRLLKKNKEKIITDLDIFNNVGLNMVVNIRCMNITNKDTRRK